MSPEQENIIKDKLLEYEVPFEEKYWKDFQKKANTANTSKKNHDKKYYGLALLAFLSFSFFLINKNLNQTDSIADNQNNSAVNVLSTERTSNLITTNKNAPNAINGINKPNEINKANDAINANQNNVSFNQLQNITERLNVDNRDKHNTSIANAENLNNIGTRSNQKRSKQAVKLKTARNPLNEVAKTSNFAGVKDQLNSTSNSTSALNNSSNFYNKNTAHTNAAIPTNLGNNIPIGNINNGSMLQSNYSNISTSEILENKASTVLKNSSALEQKINASVQLNAVGYLPPSSKINNLKKDATMQASEDVNWEISKTRDWEIGVYGGIGLNIPTQNKTDLEKTYNIQGGGPNLTAGAYFNYFLNKKISLETGFKYKKISNHFSAGYSNINNVDLIRVDEVSIVQNLQSFEIPIGINLKVSYWLSLSTGISLAYVKPTDVFTDLKIENPTNNPNIEDYKYLNTFSNYGIRKLDARVYAGLTFNISPFISFRMLVNQGLVDRTNNDYYNSSQYNVHTDYSFSTILRFNKKALK